MDAEELLKFDGEHVWHPYASVSKPPSRRIVRGACGAKLDVEGVGELVDGMSSWWAVVHGYNNAFINAAVEAQLGKMSHVMFGGFTHEGAVELARKLLKIVPKGLAKVFYSDSGSVAMEVAMKMALQYWSARGFGKKRLIATIRGGYHGDTWHTMSVCDPVTGMHARLFGGLPVQVFAPRPEIPFGAEWNSEGDVKDILECFKSRLEEIAAVVLEPIVQGAGGMRFYHPNYLRAISDFCRESGILLIADEIATGFGRSGKLFACEYAGVSPDIMCLGKALTGGYVSFAATLASDKVADGISSFDGAPFMHGPTFMGNPLACAAANASVELAVKPESLENVARIEKILSKILPEAKNFKGVADVRVLGAIGVIETKKPVDMESCRKKFESEGVWLRPFGKLVYTMPPFVTESRDVEKIANAMVRVASEE